MVSAAEYAVEADVGLPALSELLDDRRVQRLLALDRALWYEQDLLTNEVRWTGGLLRSFGYEVAQIAPHPTWWQERTHPEDTHVLFALWEDVTRRQRSRWRLKYRFRRADGSYAVLDGHAMLVVNAAGEPVRVSGVVRDVTEQEQLQARLVRAERLSAIGKLAGGVVHDLNNLHFVLASTLEVIAADPRLQAKHQELLDDSRAALSRASELGRELLNLSRRDPPPVAVVDVTEVIRRLLPLLGRAAGSCALVSRLPDTALHSSADGGQLERVVLNLVTNARDASPDGGTITVGLETRELGQRAVHQVGEIPAGHWNVLSVTDTGSGMSPEVLGQVLEPFFTTKGSSGTGLGLHTVLGIVDRWDGYVAVDSKVGRGTTISCYLRPAAAVAGATAG
jgi:PAS domain S-box-containing protein